MTSKSRSIFELHLGEMLSPKTEIDATEYRLFPKIGGKDDTECRLL